MTPEPRNEAWEFFKNTTRTWLCERGQRYGYSPPIYWSGSAWTANPYEAERYPSRAAAESKIATATARWHDPEGRPWAEAVEHGFGATPEPRNEAAEQPLDAFLADAGLAFDDISVAMAIHRRALAAERAAPQVDMEGLIADLLALEPPRVRDDTLRGWHDALAEAAHLIRARLAGEEGHT